MIDTFRITESHIKLAKRMCVSWDDCEFGAPSINCKRPYGNSDVITDIAEILGFPIPEDGGLLESVALYLVDIHKQMQTALQIFLATQSFEVGNYKKKDEYDTHSWVKHEDF